MFKNTKCGLVYIGSDQLQYELLEGLTSNGYTSDIIFILDTNNKEKPQGVIVDFVYGGIEENKDYIQNQIEKYINLKKVNKKGDQ